MDVKEGAGTAVQDSIVNAAKKYLGELPAASLLDTSSVDAINPFTRSGLTPEQLRDFFAAAAKAGRKTTPTTESGNVYAVSKAFHALNGPLVVDEYLNKLRSLDASDLQRARAFVEAVALDAELRNRNPLHPSATDALVIGTLLDFPKQLFGFPYACYATDGRESLSLCLYAYRLRTGSRRIVGDASDETLKGVASRLGMTVCSDLDGAACVVATLSDLSLCEEASRRGVPVHVRCTDSELRQLLTKPLCHVRFPCNVSSLSIDDGVFTCGYSLYRDLTLRDAHMDVALRWQAAYLSPNEGGSGASAPLFLDFCTACLGRDALAVLASQEPYEDPEPCWDPTTVQASRKLPPVKDPLTWARRQLASTKSRKDFEGDLVAFQRHFLGGLQKDVEAVSTGGGTRSINVAFETVLRSLPEGFGRPRVLTGNPHLAVERAERRFGFALTRLEVDGAIDLSKLARELHAPDVIAVYAQSLSYTDGISDDVPRVLDLLEAVNATRVKNGDVAVALINDCCLAFSVLVHQPAYRLLDRTTTHTPVLMTLDAHKHLGADKGLSTVVGTKGSLRALRGALRVGARPTRAALVRALANVASVTASGYDTIYRNLASRVKVVEETCSSLSLEVVHACHRKEGSTVLAVHDPACRTQKLLSKRNHKATFLYNLHPLDRTRCQYGWCLSFTPHCLRELDGATALDVFVRDLKVCASKAPSRASNSIVSILMKGGAEEPWLFSFLRGNQTFRRVLGPHAVVMTSTGLDSRNDGRGWFLFRF
mmetsp:Transcript_6293/g.19011  ORF Transcript_6293/g.19011 Transcript_6293/m.19011 type:complete len:767 (+) Transcript_6293:185-2485(+)